MRRNSKRALAMILPAFAMASVIGAGYSTWFFGETTTSDVDNSIQVVVEGYTDIGVLEITEVTAKLTLDQRSGDYSTDNVSVAGAGNDYGLLVSGDVKYVHKATTEITLDNNYVFDVADYDYSITVTYNGGIQSYVKIGEDTPASYTKTYTDADNTFIAPKNVGTEVTLNATQLDQLIDPVWIAVPTTVEAYETMLDTVKGSTITIKVTATYNPAGN